MEYKIGDWCVCIVDYSHIWYNGRVWQIGAIKKYGENDFACSPIKNGEVLNQPLLINAGGFRKALPEEISGYESSKTNKPENLDYLIPMFKKLKIK